MWRMRLKDQTTLRHYLQEVVPRKVVASLTPHSRHLVQLAASQFESLLRARILQLREARCPGAVVDSSPA